MYVGVDHSFNMQRGLDTAAKCKYLRTVVNHTYIVFGCCCFSTFDCLVGRDYLDTLGYLEFDIWYNILALACFNVGYLFLSYLILRIIKKEK